MQGERLLMSMTSIDNATAIPQQHDNPCHDCPFRRKALAGWLGGDTPEEYLRLAHAETVVDCHAHVGPNGESLQCAGLAVYRANTYKRPPDEALTLPRDTFRVFATPMEFLVHHRGQAVTSDDVAAVFRPPVAPKPRPKPKRSRKKG